jgi:hypothetical protein
MSGRLLIAEPLPAADAKTFSQPRVDVTEKSSRREDCAGPPAAHSAHYRSVYARQQSIRTARRAAEATAEEEEAPEEEEAEEEEAAAEEEELLLGFI